MQLKCLLLLLASPAELVGRSPGIYTNVHRQMHSTGSEIVCVTFHYYLATWAATHRLQGNYLHFWRLDAVMQAAMQEIFVITITGMERRQF